MTFFSVLLGWDLSVSPDIIGYKVYYGNTSGVYDHSDDIPNQNTWTVSGLPPGNWYFVVTAINSDEEESDYSNELYQLLGGGWFDKKHQGKVILSDSKKSRISVVSFSQTNLGIKDSWDGK